jgi:PKD repeat protein
MLKSIKHIFILLVLLTSLNTNAQYIGGSADGAVAQTYTLTTCGTPSQFFAYMGGNADGAAVQTYTLTICGTPSQFFAYSGGIGDGASTKTYTLTTCGTPSQYFAYMGGNADGFALQTYTTTSCGTPSQFYAYLGGNADGSSTNTYTLTTCGTPSQFYAYMGGSGDGFARDTVTKCPTAPPVASFSATPTTICVGGTVTFTDHSTNSPAGWNWNIQGGTPSTYTVQNPTVTYNTPGTYSVSLVATNAMGSNTVTATSYITVNAFPTANAGSDVSICAGSTTTLTALGGTSYSWTPSTGLSATNISNPVANPTVTTIYSVTVTKNGCSATDAMTLTVNSIPVANAGSDAAICFGSATTFTASGGTTYSWTPSTGLSSATSANPAANPTVTTIYSVTASNGSCSATDALTLTVNSLPTANAGSDAVICSGSSSTLTATGGASYSWGPATGLSSTTIANPVASPTATTNYSVTVTDINGCTAADVMTLTVNSLPSANAGSDVTICTGNSTTLTATGGTSYTWTPSAGLSATNVSSPVANPTATTTYSVLVTDVNGCQASDAVVVTVTSTLVANAGSDVAICDGSSTALSGNGGSTYSWSPAAGLNSTTVSNPVATPTVTTTYTLTISSGGCNASDNVVVTVNPLPTVTVTAGGPTTFCQGDSVTLTSSVENAYLWSNSATTQSIKIFTSGNYNVTVTNTFSCSATSSNVNVVVHPLGTASISASGATTFCAGDSISLSANSGASYSWSTGATTQSIYVLATGTYSVTVPDVFGCSVPSPTASIAVTVNPNPPTPTITANGTTNLCVGDSVYLKCSPANSYLWSTGATTDSIFTTAAGTYSVIAYNGFGCSAKSSVTTVNVNTPLADFVGSPLLVFTPTATVTFTATTTGVPPYTYLWNFGDGGSSTLAGPSHFYGTIGYDTVSLKVTDSTGCSNTVTKLSYVEVEQLFPSTAMITGTGLNLTSVSFAYADTGIVTLTDGNCILSVDSGNNWMPIVTGNTQALNSAFSMPRNWFVSGVNGTILNSMNNGATWTTFTTSTTETFNSISLSSGSNGYAVGTNGVAHFYNGSIWAPTTTGATVTLNGVEALPSGDAIAVGDGQTILNYSAGTWTPQISPLNFDIKGVKFLNNTLGYAVGTNGNILQTNNGGGLWSPVLTGVDIDFNSVEVEGSLNAWACGTHGIVYKTTDGGSTWIRYSVGYTNPQNSIRVSNGKGHIVGSSGNGRNYGTTGSSEIFKNFNPSNEFTVHPNPAHDKFTVSGYLKNSESLTIQIKDMAGNHVETLIDSPFSGKYSSEINTTHYPAGVYFIHVNKGALSWVQKLIIVK